MPTESEKRAIRQRADNEIRAEMTEYNNNLKAQNLRQKKERIDLFARHKEEDRQLMGLHKLALLEIRRNRDDDLAPEYQE